MQTTEDGAYVPSKELNLNFKIPKKKIKPTTKIEVEPQLQQQSLPNIPQTEQVLDNSYYNYSAGMNAYYYNQYQNEAANYGVQTVTTYSNQPVNYDPAQNLVMTILQSSTETEKPKTYANHIMRETIPDCFDESLPKALTLLFQPLYCKLCSAQLSSNIVARLHYKSKNHEKKIRKFLIDYSQQTGEPLHKRARLSGKHGLDLQEPQIDNPMYYHCDVCDLPLTGKLHAESHYMGKNHRKATLGLKNPAGKGRYDAEGKWVRDKRTLSGDGFGESFREEQPKPKPVSGYICELCNVTTTCKEQLESHYKGQKHLKKLKRLNPDAVIVPPEAADATTVSSLGGDLAWRGDSSAYRTPSGNYYCPICNNSMNSEVQFRQHMVSKNHMKKAALKKS